VEAFIFKIEKKYYIYLIIIIVVLIYTSVIVLPYNAVGKTLHGLEIESNSIVENVPSFKVGLQPISIAVDQSDNIAYVVNSGSGTISAIYGPGQ
jgi:DNA-binding beta-propeller fold protein YncE